MPRTRLLADLRRILALARSADRAGEPTAAHLERLAFTRRAALGLAGLSLPLIRCSTGAVAAIADAGAPDGTPIPDAGGAADAGLEADAGLDADAGAGPIGPRIAIVGAGLAGLHAAHILALAGHRARIFEAGDRVGGRVLTVRGQLAEDQIADLGGELIDSDHTTALSLADGFGLTVDDLYRGERGGVTYRFMGRFLGEAELTDAFRPFAAKARAALRAVESDDDEFDRVDALSIAEWLAGIPEATPLLTGFMTTAYVAEYGLEASEQSALNLIYLLDASDPSDVSVFGDADERWRLHQGSDALATKLAEGVQGSIELGARLAAITELAGGAYRLSFERGAGAIEADFDHVILALPFSALRTVDLRATLSREKRRIISELGYGTNAKLIGQFTSRVWRDTLRASGTGLSDEGPLQSFWDGARAQPGASGLLTIYAGGAAGVALGAGPADAQLRAALPSVDRVFPGSAALYRPGSAVRTSWTEAPHIRGSYACYRPGQWAFYGLEGVRAGNLHFAGEHCSADYQGTMEGALQSGEAAAREILADL